MGAMKTPLYFNHGGKTDSITVGALGAVLDFGERYLGTEFQPKAWIEGLPTIDQYEGKDGVVRVDSYRQALWDVYNELLRLYRNGEKHPTLPLDVTDMELVTDRDGFVYGSSCQYLDLDTGELLMPDKAAVIITRTALEGLPDDLKQNSAYFLGLHEILHLAMGRRRCDNHGCLFYHAGRDYLIENAKTLSEGGSVHICEGDLDRIREFQELQKKWNADKDAVLKGLVPFSEEDLERIRKKMEREAGTG